MTKTLRTSLVITLALGAAVADATVVSTRSRGRVDVQSFAGVTGGVQARPGRWQRVQGLQLRLPCPATRSATATASMVLGRGPGLRVRVVAVDPTVSTPSGPPRRVAVPGAVPVAASSRRRTVSFTFGLPRLPGSHRSLVRLAWRSPSGRSLSLESATLRVLWDRMREPCR